jgi:hypothetical protein
LVKAGRLFGGIGSVEICCEGLNSSSDKRVYCASARAVITNKGGRKMPLEATTQAEQIRRAWGAFAVRLRSWSSSSFPKRPGPSSAAQLWRSFIGIQKIDYVN